jgi:hypothetical protein
MGTTRDNHQTTIKEGKMKILYAGFDPDGNRVTSFVEIQQDAIGAMELYATLKNNPAWTTPLEECGFTIREFTATPVEPGKVEA